MLWDCPTEAVPGTVVWDLNVFFFWHLRSALDGYYKSSISVFTFSDAITDIIGHSACIVLSSKLISERCMSSPRPWCYGEQWTRLLAHSFIHSLKLENFCSQHLCLIHQSISFFPRGANDKNSRDCTMEHSRYDNKIP